MVTTSCRKKGKLGASQPDFVGAGIKGNIDGCHFPAETNSQKFFRSSICKDPLSHGDAMTKQNTAPKEKVWPPFPSCQL